MTNHQPSPLLKPKPDTYKRVDKLIELPPFFQTSFQAGSQFMTVFSILIVGRARSPFFLSEHPLFARDFYFNHRYEISY